MPYRSLLRPAIAGLAVLASALPASAHVGHGEVHGFMHGFMHPIGGLDHLLAMIAVGMLAALLGRRALWMVPASFMAMMAVGATLAVVKVDLPFVELGISLSVIALGLAVALRLPLPVIAAVGIAGFFAVFHGAAHGAEMPLEVSGMTYAAGFLAATGLLHLTGAAIGMGLHRLEPMRETVSRVAGCAIALTGVFLAVPF